MKRRTLWFAAAAAATAVLCTEVLLRAIGFSAPVWTRPDPDLGWTLRPELREVNANGVRDREHGLAKPDDVFRIAVLGDDYSEARRLPLQNTWWWQLPQELERCGFEPRKRIEVMNFAVGGFGTAQEYVQLQSRAIRYQPDLVLLQFNNADDVRNNSFILDPEKHRPFFFLTAKDDLVIDDSFATAPSFRKRASFKHELVRRLSDKARIVQLAGTLRDLPVIGTAHAQPDRLALSAPREPIWEEAWRVTEMLIAQSHDFARRDGARLALVIAPDRSQLLNPDDSYPEKRLLAFAAARGITAIALQGELERRGMEGLFHEKEGHRAAAQLIAQQLCERSF